MVACALPGALSTTERKRIPAKWFGLPALRSYPLARMVGGKATPSPSHARNALARASQQRDRGNLTAVQYTKIVTRADAVLAECDPMPVKRQTEREASREAAELARLGLEDEYRDILHSPMTQRERGLALKAFEKKKRAAVATKKKKSPMSAAKRREFAERMKKARAKAAKKKPAKKKNPAKKKKAAKKSHFPGTGLLSAAEKARLKKASNPKKKKATKKRKATKKKTGTRKGDVRKTARRAYTKKKNPAKKNPAKKKATKRRKPKQVSVGIEAYMEDFSVKKACGF